MTIFLHLLDSKQKENDLLTLIRQLKTKQKYQGIFEVDEKEFSSIPGAPFAYWVSQNLRKLFEGVKNKNFSFKPGIATGDDFRFLRSWFEVTSSKNTYIPISKGGKYSPFYYDIDLVINWQNEGSEFLAFDKCQPRNIAFFRSPGVTWPFRTNKGLNTRVLPRGCAFTIQGMAGFNAHNDEKQILFLLAITNSSAFQNLLLLTVGSFAFQAGAMSSVPIPIADKTTVEELAFLAKKAWSKRRLLDQVNETSHAFLLPAILRLRMKDYDPVVIESDLMAIQAQIDDITFKLYGFSTADREAAKSVTGIGSGYIDLDNEDGLNDFGEDVEVESVDQMEAMLSWAVGVAFGRFDWRLATGERVISDMPEPFDPLPSISPGMLQDSERPFHNYGDILVEDKGHPHDIVHLVEEILSKVDVAVPENVRKWIQSDFFPLHYQRYSKSRRKAPIYWPISTVSGGYTLWIYYPRLSSQTLYSAVNDFIEPKLMEVSAGIAILTDRGSSRTRDDEKEYEFLKSLQLELIELNNVLLSLASNYQPCHDDGVQVTASPLWPLFKNKPWQKTLKETWERLEKGEYDWAKIAMHYWPERIRDKCITNKSLAIAHGLEGLYKEPDYEAKVARKKNKASE